MFFDTKMMNSKTVGTVWKLANNMKTDKYEETNLPNICEKLDRWVDSDQQNPRGRLSLRTSSTLISGAAKLYQKKIHQLDKDIMKFDYQLIRRKRLLPTDNQTKESPVSPVLTPEQVLHHTGVPKLDTTTTLLNKRKRSSATFTTSEKSKSKSDRMSLTTDSSSNSHENTKSTATNKNNTESSDTNKNERSSRSDNENNKTSNMSNNLIPNLKYKDGTHKMTASLTFTEDFNTNESLTRYIRPSSLFERLSGESKESSSRGDDQNNRNSSQLRTNSEQSFNVLETAR